MLVSDLREKTIALFERHRETPGAPFDAEHFLDFLLDSPKANRAVYNSFSGLRRFNAFIDELQLTFAVCLSRQDRDANYSLDRFVARLEQLQRSPRGSLASIGNQSKGGVDVNVLIVGNVVFLVAMAGLRSHAWGVLAIIALDAAFNVWYLRFYLRGRRYLAKLHQRIVSEKGNDA
jgi:hypothetical protein